MSDGSLIYRKINITNYYKPDLELIHSTNIDFNHYDDQKPYFKPTYKDIVLNENISSISFVKDNLTSSSIFTYNSLSSSKRHQLLDQYMCKNIEINELLLKSSDFIKKLETLLNDKIKYCIVKGGQLSKSMWVDEKFNSEYNQLRSFDNSQYNLKLLGLKEPLELIYLDVLKLICNSLPSEYCYEVIKLKSLSYIPLLYGFKKADYLHLIKTYGIDIVHPDLHFYKSCDHYEMLFITKKSNYTNLLISKNLIKDLLNKIRARKMYLKNFNNTFNDYVLSGEKIHFMLSNSNILHYLKGLMFDHAVSIELTTEKSNEKYLTICSTNEQNLLCFLKYLHFKIYDKILQFSIDLKNKENFDICCKDFMNDPYLTVISNESNLNIVLVGDRWDDLFTSYMKLNQKNIKYNFFLDLSNEFKEFIIGKKFGKINKIEKSLNNKCSLSLLIPNYEDNTQFQDTEFITIKIESNSFVDSINCLKLVQQELPYEKQLYIPESFHKYIIGINGENIQSITRRYNCFIQFMNTFENKQNEFGFIRYPNVIIRCPLKTAPNVEKVINEIQSLSMEIFNLKKITSLDNQNEMELQGIKILKLKKAELDLILNGSYDATKKLHHKIGELEMKYNLFIRFPEYDDDMDDEDDGILLIFKSCKHNTVLKIQDTDKQMSILKLTENDDKRSEEFVEDENLQLCINEIMKDYVPKKDKGNKYNMNQIKALDESQLKKLQRLLIWKYNNVIQKDKDGGYYVYTI
ncbi:uncharacterized protein HGUI_00993 [Hanseniaspora guilliermondii]|uniref:K Homology domain-containing protein n=1 Tax=Hanseniaspora guilliermondii TaxID=56406 RepID=A0A1L0CK98_9ASCO|nr:uncharacterized protein HGUI_00993 [Hanseniaspora guilliermondii]